MAGGVGVVASRIPVRSVLALILTLVSLAAMFIAVGAEFIGLVQIIVYAGAVMVLFVFVISLLSARNEPLERPVSLLPGQEKSGAVAAGILAVGLVIAGFAARLSGSAAGSRRLRRRARVRGRSVL